MKSLGDYTEKEITKIYQETGAFFAFNQEQFDKEKKEGTTYVKLPSGLFCPKENAQTLVLELTEAFKKGEELYLAENGIENIIKYELNNHECYYTGDWQDAYEEVARYGVTEEQVLQVYKDQLHKQQLAEELEFTKSQPAYNINEAAERILTTQQANDPDSNPLYSRDGNEFTDTFIDDIEEGLAKKQNTPKF